LNNETYIGTVGRRKNILLLMHTWLNFQRLNTFDEGAKQYVEKIGKEYDYNCNARRIPYLAPCYTKKEYEESISFWRKKN
jgi:hypothetical protein